MVPALSTLIILGFLKYLPNTSPRVPNDWLIDES